jgi:hypothetical protein
MQRLATRSSPPGDSTFGAFLDPVGRERDFVLGRLDAAEHLLGLVRGFANESSLWTPSDREQDPYLAALCDLFRAVLDEELPLLNFRENVLFFEAILLALDASSSSLSQN